MSELKSKRTFVENVDYFFNKMLPKKIIVITIATIIVFKGLEAPQEYWIILMAYFGVNLVSKFTDVIKNRDSNQGKEE